VKLCRSQAEGKVFDVIPPVRDRYVTGNARGKPIEIWKFNRQITWIPTGMQLRIQASAPFQLRWTSDDWRDATQMTSTSTGVGIEFVDLVPGERAAIRFMFFWVQENRWEDDSYAVEVRGTD
jgi:glucoamylase